MDLSSEVTVSHGEGPRQLLKPVKPRGVDPAIQAGGRPAICCEKAQESTQGCDVVLQTGSAETLASLVDVCLHVLGLDGTERDLLRLKVLQKALRCESMVADGRGCESTNLTQVIRILVAQDRQGGRPCGFSSAGSDHAGSDEISLQRPHGTCVRREDLDQATPAIVERRVG